MADTENTKQKIVCIGPGYSKNNRTRTTSIYELLGYIAETQLETPITLDDAKRIRDEAFSVDAGNDITLAVKQSKALHDLLSFYPDESEASGNGERADELRRHEGRYGRLSWGVVYYLLRHALSGSYKKVARKQGRQNIKTHPNNTKKAAFEKWASARIRQGANPRNITEIKRLVGFDKAWGTDVTIKKWWRGIDGAPALKPGASRT